MSTLAPLITEAVDGNVAGFMILTMAGPAVADGLLATRLASRFPAMPVFTLDPSSLRRQVLTWRRLSGSWDSWPTLATESYRHTTCSSAPHADPRTLPTKTGL